MLSAEQLMLLCMAKHGSCMNVLGVDVSKLDGDQVGDAPYGCYDIEDIDRRWYAITNPASPTLGKFFDEPEDWLVCMRDAIKNYTHTHGVTHHEDPL